MSGVVNISIIQTTPGAERSDPFCPPLGFNGSTKEYVELVRQRYRSDRMAQQRIIVTAWYAGKPSESVWNPMDIRGPYAEAARRILQRLIKPSSNEAA